MCLCLLAQVVGQTGTEIALPLYLHGLHDGRRLRPIASTLVNAQQSQVGAGSVGGIFQTTQSVFCTIKQSCFEVILGQAMLGTLTVGQTQIGTLQQMFMDTHRTVVLPTAPKEIPQGKVQLGGIGVVLHGLNEGIDGLILLLVEQKIQALKVGFGRLSILQAHLAHIHARCQPAQRKSQGQAQQNPTQIKVHGEWK